MRKRRTIRTPWSSMGARRWPLRLMCISVITIGALPLGAFSAVLEPDPNCSFMRTLPATIPPQDPGAGEPYFDAPVPRRVHQIWYGKEHSVFGPRMQSWMRYAETFGYSYKLWTAADDELVESLLPPRNRQVWQYYRARSDYRAASDVLRLSLLEVFGGIYIDSDLQPPTDAHGPVDFADWLPLTGFAAILEWWSREVGPTAAFLTNMFLAASPGHPMVAHLVSILPDNHDTWARQRVPAAEYTTGPFLLSRALGGVVTMITMREAMGLHLGGLLDRPDPWAWGLPTPASGGGPS